MVNTVKPNTEDDSSWALRSRKLFSEHISGTYTLGRLEGISSCHFRSRSLYGDLELWSQFLSRLDDNNFQGDQAAANVKSRVFTSTYSESLHKLEGLARYLNPKPAKLEQSPTLPSARPGDMILSIIS